MFKEEKEEDLMPKLPNIEVKLLSGFRVLLSRFQRFFSEELMQKNSDLIHEFLKNSSKAYQEILSSCLSEYAEKINQNNPQNESIFQMINAKIIWEAAHIVYIEKKNCKARDLVEFILEEELYNKDLTDSSYFTKSFPKMFTQKNSFGPRDPNAEIDLIKFWKLKNLAPALQFGNTLKKEEKNPFLHLLIEQKNEEIQSLLSVISEFIEKEKIQIMNDKNINPTMNQNNFGGVIGGETKINGIKIFK